MRLVSLCVEVVRSHDTLSQDELSEQYILIRTAFLPGEFRDLPTATINQLTDNWEYGVEYQGRRRMISSGFGHLFHFSTTYGLYNAVT